MVARHEYGSFFGIVPESIAPPAQSMTSGDNTLLKTYESGDCGTVGSARNSLESPECLEDEQTWSKWHKEDLSNILSHMFAMRQVCKCDVSQSPCAGPRTS